jgi:hypothetical protein
MLKKRLLTGNSLFLLIQHFYKPKFYNTYIKASQIIDMGSRSQSKEEQKPELDN